MWVVVIVALWPAGGPVVDVLSTPDQLQCYRNAADWRRIMRQRHPSQFETGGFVIECVQTDAYGRSLPPPSH